MTGARSQAWQEYGFLVLLVVLCALVAFFQFRWTGEVAKAEFTRLGGNQREAAEEFCDAFDLELSSACDALLPPANGLSPEAIAKRVKRWQNGDPKAVFSKMGLAIPKNGELSFQLIDLHTGKMAPAPWPEEWAGLQENLESKAAGHGFVPFRDQTGLLMEYPLYGQKGNPPRGGGPGMPPPPREAAWVIFGIDQNYLQKVWLPELVKRFLNPGEREFYQVRVLAGDEVIFSAGPRGGAADVTRASFNFQGRVTGNDFGPPRQAKWVLETGRQTGALEKVVASSRRRNLALAGMVNGLILVAGFALVYQTRRSRRLADAQMNFVANISHELRTPITVIKGAAHNLKRGIVRTPEALDRYAGMILQHSNQLSEMVQEVLEFSAAKRGKLTYQRSPVDLAEILRDAITASKGETGSCEVEVSIPDGLPPVMGDGAALGRAFRNLIGNAGKHGGAGGWIGVTAAQHDGLHEITIADRGPGIPKPEQGHIFKPFFRGAQAHENQVRGSGIGLGLVREIIAAHGGRVSVCSERGNGAKFVISLPVDAAVNDGSEHIDR